MGYSTRNKPKVLRYKLQGKRTTYHQNGYGRRRRHNIQKGGSIIAAVGSILRGVAGPLLGALGIVGGGGGGGNSRLIAQMMRQNQQSRQMMMQMMMMNKKR